jgi:colanic acid biosynthesis glycosyl transferase WcaI
VGGEIVNSSYWVDRWEEMHRRALRQAARVVVLGDDMRDRIIAKGVSPERVVIVRDGASSLPSMPDRGDPVVQQIRCGFPFVAIHAGNLGFYGAWGTLLKAAEILRNEGLGLVFVGDGANRVTLETSSKSSPNVRFWPFFPVEQVRHVMMAGDVHIVTVRRGLEGVVVPSKLYSILAAGRPALVVAPATTDAARIVTETGCGMSADPDDPAAVAAALLALRGDPARLAHMGARAREVAAKYARVNELDRFVNVMEEAGNHSNL